MVGCHVCQWLDAICRKRAGRLPAHAASAPARLPLLLLEHSTRCAPCALQALGVLAKLVGNVADCGNTIER